MCVAQDPPMLRGGYTEGPPGNLGTAKLVSMVPTTLPF